MMTDGSRIGFRNELAHVGWGQGETLTNLYRHVSERGKAYKILSVFCQPPHIPSFLRANSAKAGNDTHPLPPSISSSKQLFYESELLIAHDQRRLPVTVP